jgi:hypothetical protein
VEQATDRSSGKLHGDDDDDDDDDDYDEYDAADDYDYDCGDYYYYYYYYYYIQFKNTAAGHISQAGGPQVGCN